MTASTVLMVAEVESLDGASTTATGDYESFPVLEYRHRQRPRIPVLVGHDKRSTPVGEVRYLKYVTNPERLVAVAEVDLAVAADWHDRPCYVSPSTKAAIRQGRHRDIHLDHLGLVDQTARVAPRPVAWVMTNLDERHNWYAQMSPHYALLCEAEEHHRRFRYSPDRHDGLPIIGHPHAPATIEARAATITPTRVAHGTPHVTLADEAARLITIAPLPTTARPTNRGHYILRAYARGLDGTNRITTIGRSIEGRSDLFRVAPTPAGDDVLALVADEILEATAPDGHIDLT